MDGAISMRFWPGAAKAYCRARGLRPFASRRRRSAPAPIEERRSALLQLVGVSGILFSETLAAKGAVVFAKRASSTSKALCRRGGASIVREKPQLVEDRRHCGCEMTQCTKSRQ
jgi:hypothetical protein